MKSWTLAAIVVCSASGLANAQDPLDENYGRAVHSFFRGDSLKSQELLDEVVGAGSQDPRVFYFRGIAASRNGNIDQASADFNEGARLEVAGKRVVNVGRALERIQGPVRVEIEKARAQARLDARSKVLELDRARYDALQKNGGAAAGGLVVPPSAPNASIAPLAPNDPFLNGMTRGEATANPSAPAQVTPAQETEADPFALGEPETEDAPVTNDDDAFGDNAFEPASEDAPMSEDDSDPFATE